MLIRDAADMAARKQCALLARAHQKRASYRDGMDRRKNENSIRFHDKYGFYYAGILKNVGTLDNRPRSVVIMQYDVHRRVRLAVQTLSELL